MEVIPEPNIVSDRIKAFLDDPQWPEHIKEANFLEYMIILEIILVNYSYS